MNKKTINLATLLGQLLKDRNLKITTAESCTGGGIAQAITAIPGSSAWFDRGFVTYSNNSKMQMLQVKQQTLNDYGAVSEEAAKQMAEGALINSEADLAISVTGIAGPDGGSEQKPVGTVFIAWKFREQQAYCDRHVFSGNRAKVREQTIQSAIKLCLNQKITDTKQKLTLYQKSEDYLKQVLTEKLPENSHFFLFGSRAQGTSGEMADIDIGILAEEPLSLELTNNIKEAIEESFIPYDVDLVDFRTVSESFKRQALKKVIPWN